MYEQLNPVSDYSLETPLTEQEPIAENVLVLQDRDEEQQTLDEAIHALEQATYDLGENIKCQQLIQEALSNANESIARFAITSSKQLSKSYTGRYGSLRKLISVEESFATKSALILALESEEGEQKSFFRKIIDAIFDAFAFLWRKIKSIFGSDEVEPEQLKEDKKAGEANITSFNDAVAVKEDKAPTVISYDDATSEGKQLIEAFGFLRVTIDSQAITALIDREEGIGQLIFAMMNAIKNTNSQLDKTIQRLESGETLQPEVLKDVLGIVEGTFAPVKQKMKTGNVGECRKFLLLKETDKPVEDKIWVLENLWNAGMVGFFMYDKDGYVYPNMKFQQSQNTERATKITVEANVGEFSSMVKRINNLGSAIYEVQRQAKEVIDVCVKSAEKTKERTDKISGKLSSADKATAKVFVDVLKTLGSSLTSIAKTMTSLDITMIRTYDAARKYENFCPKVIV